MLHILIMSWLPLFGVLLGVIFVEIFGSLSPFIFVALCILLDKMYGGL